MGAFIGDGEIGIWVSNSERDTFLDWFAEHRCRRGDTRWEYCMDAAQRWMGCGLALYELLQTGEFLALTDNEYKQSAVEFGPDFAKMLRIIDAISRGEWHTRVDSMTAKSWRKP
jgi:hypothetical protein